MPSLNDLYCQPSDVYDFYSTEGGQLRLDDHGLATAQTITVRADAPPGSTQIQVMALVFPVLAGSVEEFDGGGMPAVLEVVVSQTARVGDTVLNVLPTQADIPPGAQCLESGVNLALAQRMLKACQFGTAEVQDYCLSRYDDQVLRANAAQNGSVKRWASALAARWLGRRRGQTPPQGVEDEAKEVKEELKLVRVGVMNVAGAPQRTAGHPFITNVTVDTRYDYAKLRVEQPLSDSVSTQYGQYVDWNSVTWLEW
jgi:hypothetical protein